jgi:DHA1 family multidrug resistance protein-like MFS transporter
MAVEAHPVEDDDSGREAWRQTLLVTAIAQSFSIMGFAFVTPFLPLYIQTLGIHGTTRVTLWAAIMSGLVALGMAVSSPIWGALADRYGRKIMVVRAAISASLLVGLMGVVGNIYELLLLRLLAGIFTGTVSASQALVASQTPKKRLGFALGVMQTAVFSGSSLGPLMGGVAAELLGFRPTFGISAGFLLSCGLMVLFFAHETERPVHVPKADRPKLLKGMKEVLFIAGVPPMIASMFAVQFAVTQVYPILPQFVQQLQGHAGNAAAVTGFILAGAGIAGAISATTTGWFSDRVGHKRILMTAAAMAAVISVPQSFVQATWQLGLLRFFDGIALGAMLPASSAIVAGLVPQEKRATVYGLTAAAVAVAFGAGPLISAGIVAVAGIRPVFLSAALLLGIISVWVAIMVPGKIRRPISPGPQLETAEASAEPY